MFSITTVTIPFPRRFISLIIYTTFHEWSCDVNRLKTIPHVMLFAGARLTRDEPLELITLNQAKITLRNMQILGVNILCNNGIN